MDKWRIRQAVKSLEQGGVIAYPTESVFGLGCDPWDEVAVMKLLSIKQRAWKKGLILIAADFNQLQDFIEPLSAEVLAQLEQTWPGPITWLLPAKKGVPAYLTGQHQTIAVRVTAHQQTADLCHAFGSAIVSTSANLAGLPAAKTTQDVRWSLPDLDYILPGLCSGADTPSEIRDALTGKKIR
ncbi:tRNA threonylcarbamoyladenosine biosynthesis protein RimN [Methylophaga sp. 41_12_T18]|nr:tRNA threonylcarbamoyladenosine biosynthesis protein RimN [Methylophaga sp. 41_12_T18]